MKENRNDCEKILMMENTAPEKIRHLQECSSCRNFMEEAGKYMDMVRKEQNKELQEKDFSFLDMKILSHASFAAVERRRRKVIFRRFAEIAACIAVIFAGTLYCYNDMGVPAENPGYVRTAGQKNIDLTNGSISVSEEFDLMENMDALAGEVIYLSTQLDAVAYDAALVSYQS